MRQMAGDREHAIVVCGFHRLDFGAQSPPEFEHALYRKGVGTLGRRDDAPAMMEQRGEARFGPTILGARHRMRGHEHRLGQRRADRLDHAFLARADIAQDRIGRQIAGEFRRDHAHRPDRHAQDHQIGIDHRGAGSIRHVVAQVDPHRGLAHRRIHVIAGHADARHVLAHAAGDRRADQPEADHGDAAERQHQAPTISRIAAATPWISSSVPMVMRSPCGSPCPGSQRTI